MSSLFEFYLLITYSYIFVVYLFMNFCAGLRWFWWLLFTVSGGRGVEGDLQTC